MKRLLPAVLAAALATSALPARAETLLTGFAGVAFAGDTNRTRGSYGGALGFLARDGVFGFEVEFGTTPDFFGRSSDSGVFTDNDVLTLMGSFLLATPGSVRLYAAAGAGLLKTRLADPDRFFSIDSNDFGINVGGGIMGFFGEHVGLRADIRYFRDLQDPNRDGNFDVGFGNTDYWRAVGGLTFRF
jgi:hypothetical protein